MFIPNPSSSSSSSSSHLSSSSLVNDPLSSFDHHNVHLSDVHSETESSADGSFMSHSRETVHNEYNPVENNEMDDQSSDRSLSLSEYYTTPSVANEGDEDVIHGIPSVSQYYRMNTSYLDNDDSISQGNLLTRDDPPQHLLINDTSESLQLNDSSFITCIM